MSAAHKKDRPVLSSERAPHKNKTVTVTQVIIIWSWAPDGARYQDILTDWLTVSRNVTLTWLWLDLSLSNNQFLAHISLLFLFLFLPNTPHSSSIIIAAATCFDTEMYEQSLESAMRVWWNISEPDSRVKLAEPDSRARLVRVWAP
jgi:hypothetical protein